MRGELTIEILREAIAKLPEQKYPKRMRINLEDYRKLREACDFFEVCPEQPQVFTYGFCGEEITADPKIPKGCYEYDW